MCWKPRWCSAPSSRRPLHAAPLAQRLRKLVHPRRAEQRRAVALALVRVAPRHHELQLARAEAQQRQQLVGLRFADAHVLGVRHRVLAAAGSGARRERGDVASGSAAQHPPLVGRRLALPRHRVEGAHAAGASCWSWQTMRACSCAVAYSPQACDAATHSVRSRSRRSAALAPRTCPPRAISTLILCVTPQHRASRPSARRLVPSIRQSASCRSTSSTPKMAATRSAASSPPRRAPPLTPPPPPTTTTTTTVAPRQT